MAVGEVSSLAQVTVVGNQPVILDRNTIHFDNASVRLDDLGAQGVLQEPGPNRRASWWQATSFCCESTSRNCASMCSVAATAPAISPSDTRMIVD